MTLQTRKTDFPDAMPLQTRLAPVGQVDAQARTVELVFATETPVRRMRWSWALDAAIAFDEILVVSRSSINLDRLNAGGPVLDSHMTWGLSSVRAVVDRAWVDGKEARALVRFPDAGTIEESDVLFRLIEQRIVKNVSAGYSYDKVRVEKPAKEGDVERWYAERWTPSEISFVSIPADPNAQVRSDRDGAKNNLMFPIEFEGRSFDVGGLRDQMRRRQSGLVR